MVQFYFDLTWANRLQIIQPGSDFICHTVSHRPPARLPYPGGRVTKELQLTANLLSLTTVQVRIPPGAVEKVASDLGLGVVFCCVLRFPPPVTTG